MREVLAECRAQDEALRAAGLEIWLGAEPTFTDRASQDPHWLGMAEGGDKEERAAILLQALAARLAASARLLRTEGRRFPGEERPRFCLGALYRPRSRRRAGVARGGGARRPGRSAPPGGRRGAMAHRGSRPGRGRGQPGARPRSRHLRLPRRGRLRGCRRGRSLAGALPMERPRRRLRWRRPAHPGRTDAGAEPVLPPPEPAPFAGSLPEPPPVALLRLRARVRRQRRAGAAAGRGGSRAVRRAGRGARPSRPARLPGAGGALELARAAPRRRLGKLPPGRGERGEALEPPHPGARPDGRGRAAGAAHAGHARSGCSPWARSSAGWRRGWRSTRTRSRSSTGDPSCTTGRRSPTGSARI